MLVDKSHWRFEFEVIQEDIDPDWGVLKSYRTHEDQLAKNMANLERLRRVMTTDLFSEWPKSYPQDLATYEERKAWCEKEMRQRKDACKEYRKKGIIPSPGYVVFNQVDVGKERKINRQQLERLVKSLTGAYSQPLPPARQQCDSRRKNLSKCM